jgi:hypothetical protein
MLLLLALASPFLCGCQKRELHNEPLISPVQQDMGGMKGYDMPPTKGVPMPTGWKGFRAY